MCKKKKKIHGWTLFCKEIKRLSGYGITGYTAIENFHNAGPTNHRIQTKHQNTPMFLLNVELDFTKGLSFFVIPVLDTICVILRVNGSFKTL